MALINFKDGYYVVNGYWCTSDWFISCSDDELIIGVRVTRSDIIDKTLQARMRRTLRTLGVRGKVSNGLYRDARVFREIKRGGEIKYKWQAAGICDLIINGLATDDLNIHLDHGQVIKGMAVEGQIIWNEEKKKNVRKKNTRKND